MTVENTFVILCVCTGNICRSPMAERVLGHQLRRALGDDSGGFIVTSAGTQALVGEPIQDHAAALLSDLGAEVEGFQARQLNEDVLLNADLILAMTREHRVEAVALVPAAVPRLFTICEFARLASLAAAEADLGVDPSGRARALVPAATARRGLARPERPGDDDIGDPFGGPAAAYQRPFDRILKAAEAITAAFAEPAHPAIG